MRYSQSEKMEIIRLVEESDLSVKQTLEELDVPKSTFYRWYHRYSEHGYEGLASRPPNANRFWNRIPDHEKDKVVEVALDYPELSPRELDLRAEPIVLSVPAVAKSRFIRYSFAKGTSTITAISGAAPRVTKRVTTLSWS